MYSAFQAVEVNGLSYINNADGVQDFLGAIGIIDTSV
jgi:hypothetical protein